MQWGLVPSWAESPTSGHRLVHARAETMATKPDVLRRIAAIAPGNTTALEALLPDRWLAAHPEHRLEQREEESREVQARRRRKRAARRIAVAQ